MPMYAKCLDDKLSQLLKNDALIRYGVLNSLTGCGKNCTPSVLRTIYLLNIPSSSWSWLIGSAADDPSLSQLVYTIKEKAPPTGAVSWLKAPNSTFTFKTLC